MTFTVEATYESGILKPATPLPLQESERVQLTIAPTSTWADRTAGILKWDGDPEVLRQLVEEKKRIALDLVEKSYGLIPWSGDHETLRRIAEDIEFDIQECP